MTAAPAPRRESARGTGCPPAVRKAVGRLSGVKFAPSSTTAEGQRLAAPLDDATQDLGRRLRCRGHHAAGASKARKRSRALVAAPSASRALRALDPLPQAAGEPADVERGAGVERHDVGQRARLPRKHARMRRRCPAGCRRQRASGARSHDRAPAGRVRRSAPRRRSPRPRGSGRWW